MYVEPFRSNLRCMRTERGKILFITTTLMFFPPHWTQYRPKNFGSKVLGFWFKFWSGVGAADMGEERGNTEMLYGEQTCSLCGLAPVECTCYAA